MNCQDISLILDDCDVGRLSDVERGAVRVHLDACRDCAADWAAFTRIAARTPPAPPASLAGAVAEALHVRARSEERTRRSGRPLFLAGLLLAGAAAAMLGARYWPEPQTDGANVSADASSPDAAGAAELPASDPPPPATSPRELAGAPSTGSDSEPTVAEAPSRFRVLVMPARAESDDPSAAAFLERVRQTMLRELNAVTEFDVVDVTAAELEGVVPPLPEESLLSPGGERPPAIFRAVVQRFGGSVVVEPVMRRSQAPNTWVVEVCARYALGGSSGRTCAHADSAGPDDARPGTDAESLALLLMPGIAGQALPQLRAAVQNDVSVVASTLALVLDRSRAESERVSVLPRLSSSDFSPEVIAAVVELGTQSESARIRRRVWQILGNELYLPALAQPFSYALLTDPSPEVRLTAAHALRDYLDVPDALSALEYAASNDASAEVRVAVQMLMLTTRDEQRNFARARLLDSTLSPADRLALLQPQEWVPSGFTDSAVRAALTEIVAMADDPAVRLEALQGLPPMRSADVLDVFITSARDSDDRVSRFALQLLTRFVDEPGARAALEAALERENLDERLASDIRNALSPPTQ